MLAPNYRARLCLKSTNIREEAYHPVSNCPGSPLALDRAQRTSLMQSLLPPLCARSYSNDFKVVICMYWKLVSNVLSCARWTERYATERLRLLCPQIHRRMPYRIVVFQLQ